MKTMFVYALYKKKFLLSKKSLEALNQSFRRDEPLGLCSAINFLNSLPGIQHQLKEQGWNVQLIKGDHSYETGQVLGCDMPQLAQGTYQGYVYIGDGAFHPKGMQLNSSSPIFTYNPFDESFELFTSDAQALKRKHKAAISKFLMHDKIGIIITLKHGQNRYVLVDRLMREYPQKTFYCIIYDNLEFNSLNNFPFVDVWVNTMCPRIALDDTNKIDKPIVNIIDIFNLTQTNTIRQQTAKE